MERMQYKMERMRNRMEAPWASRSARPQAATAPSTNTAWKRWRRLEEEQTEFKEFLDRLRPRQGQGKEFDQFMAQHKPRPTPPQDGQPQA